MLLPQKIKTHWCSKNKKHYENKGYVYTGNSTELIVDVNDLPYKSNKIVKFKCDICGKIFESEFRQNRHKLHSCENKSCRKRRRELQCELKHGEGIIHTSQLQSTKDKHKQTVEARTLERQQEINNNIKLGMSKMTQEQRENIRIKQKLAHDKKTKEDWEKISQKRKQTYKNRTGYEHNMQNPEAREKTNNTNIQRYGAPWQTQTKRFFKKRIETLNNNESHRAASKAQKRICKLLSGKLNLKIKKEISYYWLDIALPNQIYIELDGRGHFAFKDNQKKEKIRYNFLKQLGWKMIRFICISGKYPDDKQIIDISHKCIQYVSNNNIDILVNFDTYQICDMQNNIITSDFNDKTTW